MGIVETIALSMGLAWASGINLYATLAVLGILGTTGHMVLPEELEVLQNPAVIAAAGFMYCVEFFADKVPGVDTTWDTLHSFVRIPAGAILAAAAVSNISPEAEVTALILGGGLAAASHGMKSGTRILINTSPEPFSNWVASVTEDVVVVAGIATAVYHPAIFLALLGAFILLAIWLLPKIWRGIKALFVRVKRLFGSKTPEPDIEPVSAAELFRPKLLKGQHPGGEAGPPKAC